LKRAESVKEYLVKERGVDAGRITTRSAAATKPVDTGTSLTSHAKNRRVEVIFVPEGASLPKYRSIEPSAFALSFDLS